MRHLLVTLLSLFVAVPLFAETPIAVVSQAFAQEKQKYTCPMHPHYIANEPGSCPICGMDLVPLETEEGSDATSAPEVSKRARVKISPQIIQKIGVRMEPAELTEFGREVRSYGLVTENTRLQTMISGRVEGWIEELAVTAVGDEVEKDALLFSLYSPDLISAQQDYLSALGTGAQGRIRAAGRRLQSLGVQESPMENLRQTREIYQQVPFYAETAGIVSELPVRVGSFVKPGDMIAAVQDYSTVWIRAAVAEKDISMLEEGIPARAFFPNLAGTELTAVVDYIHPTIDTKTRTGQVRLVLANPDGVLRPGAYADMVFEVGTVKRLAIPSEAILQDSSGNYVIIALGDGQFEARSIKTGVASRGQTEVVTGVNSGEMIVVSGQFLIDSESALRESFRKLQRVQTPLSLLEIDATQLAMIDHLVDAALYIHEALVDGYDVDADFLNPALEIEEALWPEYGDTRLAAILKESSGAIRMAQKARKQSELLETLDALVVALEPWLLQGKPQYYKSKGLSFYADHDNGRKWLQLSDKPLNPYSSGAAHEIQWPDIVDIKDVEDEDFGSNVEQPMTGVGHVH